MPGEDPHGCRFTDMYADPSYSGLSTLARVRLTYASPSPTSMPAFATFATSPGGRSSSAAVFAAQKIPLWRSPSGSPRMKSARPSPLSGFFGIRDSPPGQVAHHFGDTEIVRDFRDLEPRVARLSGPAVVVERHETTPLDEEQRQVQVPAHGLFVVLPVEERAVHADPFTVQAGYFFLEPALDRGHVAFHAVPGQVRGEMVPRVVLSRVVVTLVPVN